MKYNTRLPVWASILLVGTLSAAIWALAIAITIIAWETFQQAF